MRYVTDVGALRLERLGMILLAVGSGWPAPLGTAAGITLTGDRLLGLAALVLLVLRVLRRRIRWTPIHSALGVFVGTQVVTTALNAHAWPQGLKFVTVYLLGFACFAVAAEWTRSMQAQRWMVGCFLIVAAVAAIAGAATAHLSNFYRQPWYGTPWQTGVAQVLFLKTPNERALFAPRISFGEWNLFSSFLLVPFTLGLWAWRRESAGQWVLVAAVGAMVHGLVAGVTRAAWVAMIGIVALWWKLRRPRVRQMVGLGLLMATALLLQAVAFGISPVWYRFVDPWSLRTRADISSLMLESWRERPVLGHGAGSSYRLSLVYSPSERIDHVWNGNLELFVLYDSGLLGLAALLGLFVALLARARRAIRAPTSPAVSALAGSLLIGVGALAIAYQFTHGLWLMYPYVVVGVLTAATEIGHDERSESVRPAPLGPGRSEGRAFQSG